MAQVEQDQGLPSMEVFSSHGIGGINCISLHPTDPQIYWIGVAQGGMENHRWPRHLSAAN